MKILHIASENVAGVPGILINAERKLGHYSRLITYFSSPTSQWDDIVLNLPFSNISLLISIKRLMKLGTYKHEYRKGNPPEWNPKFIEKVLYLIRDIIWDYRIRPIMDFIRSFDWYILDGGLGILRCGKIIESLKMMGKKIAILYLGSDLRSRGALIKIENLADIVFTTEFDHLFIHPEINHIFFPFEVDKFKPKELLKNEKLTICHAPTNRYLKGTKYLIDAIESINSKYDFDFLLMENLPHEKVLKLKEDRCDVLVDQLTDLGGYGYGMNSMECLSMGIPCVTYMNPKYEKFIPDHPFINANKDNIREVLEGILSKPAILIKKGWIGREWVIENHHHMKVSHKILKLMEKI